MLIDFESIFKISICAMKLNRSHPEVPRNKKWALQFVSSHGLFTLIGGILFYNMVHDVKMGNFSDACRHGTLSVIYVIITFQYLVLLTNQKTILKIMQMMKNDFSKDWPEDEKAVVLDYARNGRNVCMQWLVMASIAAGMFPAKHIVLEIHSYVKGDLKLLMLYPLLYPSPIEEHKMDPLVYAVIYVVLLYYALYAACMYIAFVPLGPAFMLHACGQIEIVRKRASDLYLDTTEEEVKVKLVEIVKLLQYIYGFVDFINDSFRVVYELTLKATAIMLPIACYEVIGSFHRGEMSVEFITIIFGGILITSTPCYYSDMLMEKGEQARLSIYSCGWEARYEHGARKSIIIILQRALQPIAIRTMFRTACLDELTNLFQQSYAIFNLMNAAWE